MAVKELSRKNQQSRFWYQQSLPTETETKSLLMLGIDCQGESLFLVPTVNKESTVSAFDPIFVSAGSKVVSRL